LEEKVRFEVKRHQIDMQPIRNLGEFTANVRLTMDLVPEIKIIVHREGEALEEAKEEKAAVEETPAAEPVMEETPAAEEVVEEVPADDGEETAVEEASETVEE